MAVGGRVEHGFSLYWRDFARLTDHRICVDFSLGSVTQFPRFHQWLYRHPWFGPSLQRWEQGRLVSHRGKWAALFSMSLSAALLLWLDTPRWLAAFAIICMLCVLLWLWSRPEPTD